MTVKSTKQNAYNFDSWLSKHLKTYGPRQPIRSFCQLISTRIKIIQTNEHPNIGENDLKLLNQSNNICYVYMGSLSPSVKL